ncbi:MAG: GNAT family N-acetyltransferase [Micrococcales bacterium]|nr:GNAT family N-acetyltransferase [Micrococcales bacterium]
MTGEHTAYQISRLTEEHRQAFETLDQIVWADEPTAPDWPLSGGIETARAFVASPDGQPPFAGIYAHYDARVTVPGPLGSLAQVPMPGLTWVGVHPDHTRRGVLSTMLRHHLADLHEQGIALSGLHASEAGIYGRFGYAIASLDVTVSVGGSLEAPGVDAGDVVTTFHRVHGAEPTVERIAACYHRLAPSTLGAVDLPDVQVQRSLHDHPMSLRGSEPYHVLFASRGGQDVGFAVLRRSPSWDKGLPEGKLACTWLEAADPPALLALARRLAGFDLMASVEAPVAGPDSPLVWWLGGPRAARLATKDALWVRLVDVDAALAQRGYAAPASLVLDVADRDAPWNARRWRLDVSDAGLAQCVPTDDAPDLWCEVTALGSAHLGLRRFAEMAAQGLVSELRPGALAEADRAWATAMLPAGSVSF